MTVSKPNYESDHNDSELYAVDVASGATRQLTFERKAVGGAAFSPDGHTLAFLASDTAGLSQIWLMPMSGGETRRLTSHATGVEHFSWRPDGGAIAYAAGDAPPRRDGDAKHLTTFTVGDQDLFLRQNIQPQHIWVADTRSAAARRLTPSTSSCSTWAAASFAPSPPLGASRTIRCSPRTDRPSRTGTRARAGATSRGRTRSGSPPLAAARRAASRMRSTTTCSARNGCATGRRCW